jgi:FkbM family methyltransferase
MSLATKAHDLRHEVKRVTQAPRTFTNWRPLLGQMAAARLGRGAPELTFRTKAGPTLTCPNIPGARLPLYEQYADDCYRLREFLAPLQGRPLQVFDVGAHIGSFATNVAALHSQSRIECFEPSARSAEYLRRNVEQNGLAARITVHEVALADKEGTALFDDNEGGSVHNGLMRADQRLVDGTDALAERHAVEVPTTTFDKAVSAAPAPPQLVKMDCEGGEYSLVYASSPQSWASVEAVVMEYHPVPGESWDQLRAWLQDVGLDVVRHETHRPGLGTAWLVRRRVDSAEGPRQ